MKRNRKERSSTTADVCLICGKPKGMVVAMNPMFQGGKVYSTGPHTACEAKLDKMIEDMMTGGTLMVCTECKSISVQQEVPEQFEPFVTTMPGGGRRLEITGCPNCIKEVTGEASDQKPGEDTVQAVQD